MQAFWSELRSLRLAGGLTGRQEFGQMRFEFIHLRLLGIDLLLLGIELGLARGIALVAGGRIEGVLIESKFTLEKLQLLFCFGQGAFRLGDLGRVFRVGRCGI